MKKNISKLQFHNSMSKSSVELLENMTLSDDYHNGCSDAVDKRCCHLSEKGQLTYYHRVRILSDLTDIS